MLALMHTPARPSFPTTRHFETQVLDALDSIMAAQDEITKRLIRMETRMVNLMAVHDLDRDGQPTGGTV